VGITVPATAGTATSAVGILSVFRRTELKEQKAARRLPRRLEEIAVARSTSDRSLFFWVLSRSSGCFGGERTPASGPWRVLSFLFFSSPFFSLLRTVIDPLRLAGLDNLRAQAAKHSTNVSRIPAGWSIRILRI